jgi:putative transposase
MWTALVNRGKTLVALTGKAVRGVLRGVKEWSRPARVAAHAIADIRKTKTELIAENALLRQQLIAAKRQLKRARLTRSERAASTLLARLTRCWRGAILVVQPETVLRWHRELFKLTWWLKSKPKNPKPKNKIAIETIRLIRQMAKENRFWGAERLRGELLKLGIHVAKRTIQKYMRKARKGTSPGGQRWATFLHNHAHEIWACDFVQTYDAFFRHIFAFVIVKHDTREVVHHAVTYHPTQEWTAQQLRNATFDAAPRFLIRDGDNKYGSKFDKVAKGRDIKIIRSLHPNMNALCERFLGSLRRECLDHVLLLGEKHMRRLVREYADYFNERRAHQGIGQAIPKGPANDNVLAVGKVVARPILGGLCHDYQRAA